MDIFCKIINGDIPSRKIYEDDIVMIIMDVNPRSAGHSLVIPKVHYQDLFDIPDDVISHIMKVGRDISKVLMEKLNCDGITLEENNRLGQEVKHFHLHLIPRYKEKKELNVEEVFKILEK